MRQKSHILSIKSVISVSNLSILRSKWHKWRLSSYDNSTQSYFNNKVLLDEVYELEENSLEVRITYNRNHKDGGSLKIWDNAMGMSYEELQHAMHIALPPDDTSGRSKYGMGLKTAATWIGNVWTMKTTEPNIEN